MVACLRSAHEQGGCQGGIGMVLLLAVLCVSLLIPLSACASAKTEAESEVSGGTASTSVSKPSGLFMGSLLNDVKSTSKEQTTPASAGIVVIDAGHQTTGDYDQEPIGPGASETKYRVSDGAQGAYTGVPECEVNLEVAFKLQADLEAKGFTVYMVRTSNDVDISNAERAQYANQMGADLFIRLHCDGVDDPSVNGFLTLYPGENEFTEGITAASYEAACIMHPIIVSELGANDRGIVARTDLSGFNWCTVPTVLFEMGVMSNETDDYNLVDPDYQQRLADAITDATVAYFQQRQVG